MPSNSSGLYLETRSFIKHLRLNYQIFVLSGAYFAGGVFSPKESVFLFALGYVAVHLFLFAGATAYNSFWDKDEGPIGGLYAPPRMVDWMLPASWVVQAAGLVIAFFIGWKFVLVYLLGAVLFWLYSSPLVRLKTVPVFALMSMSIAGGFLPFVMGYLAFGGDSFSMVILSGALGTAFVIASLYPFSQAYQLHDDSTKGDMTFCVRYGYRGVRNTFLAFYYPGIFLFTFAFLGLSLFLGIACMIFGSLVGFIIFLSITRLSMTRADYQAIMWIKYSTSTLNLVFLLMVFWNLSGEVAFR